ncbi:SoxR reducing system RseC family protein [Prosthecochloris sp. SCSIO W1101]|uniref:SoxR reducing system RseC family protein n=1 Tax=Prosthecochloris sp. SCSIO W1101 TaxID=2992242 RepID=UPI00223CB5C9|nr:SoxR reducing system RseC family protein [Prosthecochloris sp. SCSIO W1101]UZJ40202.1 SoxR reducing system RseC family protein [Prosthecochloris sp. SCSIO W1101]
MYAKVLKTYKGKAEIEIVCTEASKENVHCGACSMGQKPSAKPQTVLAQNKIEAKPGDMVECDQKEHAEVKAALMLLIGPLVLFMIALGIANALNLELWQSFLSGAAVLGVTYIVLRYSLKNKTYYYITGIK